MDHAPHRTLGESTFRKLMQAAPDGVVIVDRAGLIVFANAQAEQMFGFEEGELLGKPIELLVSERYRRAHGEHRERYHAHPRTRPMAAGLPLSGRRKDGSELPVEVALSPLETEEGVLTTAIVRDGSERRKLEQLKERFLSTLSHELRTPINAIMGFASVLDDELAGPLSAEQHAYLARILKGSDVLLALIEDLLDLSRIQAGKFHLHPQALEVGGLAQEVCDGLRPLADQKAIRLGWRVADDVPTIHADPLRVRQVLVNLLGNAIKFTPEGGQIGVHVRLEGDAVLVEVEDSGIGIAATDLEKLFIPFSQLDASRTRRAGGTGLGLSIAKSLVDAHGGRVGVRSVPSRGSTFWFSLPVQGPHAG